MAITFSGLTYHTDGARRKVTATMAITSGTGTVTAAALGLTQLDSFKAEDTSGYSFQYTPSTGVVLAMYGDYSNASDGVFVNDTSASVTAIPVEAVGY